MYAATAHVSFSSAREFLRRFPCTAVVLAAIWSMFAVELLTHALGNRSALLHLGALSTAGIRQHDYWRLFTYALLHSGWWHIGLNTLLLALCAPTVERSMGSWRTLAIILLGAVLGGVGILIAHRQASPSIEVGASGACFALLGTALALTWRRGRGSSSRLSRRFVVVLIIGLAFSLLPGISMAAHLAGLAVGIALARVWRVNTYGTNHPPLAS